MWTDRLWRQVLPMAAAATAVWTMTAVAVEAAGPLVSHQAVYRVSLASAKVGSGVADADGAVLYRFTDTCDGWAIENRTAVRLGLTKGGETLSDWTYASWESKDGHRFRFQVRDRQDGEMVEAVSGSARLDGDDAGGEARFVEPEERIVELPPGTLFPTDHLQGLFGQLRDGAKTNSEVIFDGADLGNPYRVSAVARPAPQAVRHRLAGISGLADLPVWAVRLAYFSVPDGDTTPAYEVGVHYREDGIGDSILQDFGDLVLKLELQDVEVFPAPDC